VLTSKDGSQTFSTNYADHLKAVAVYKRVFGVK
jgi:cell division protein YceG involved in septum cleavage